MDDFSLGGKELEVALQHLRKLNRIFAAAGPTLYGVKKLWKRMGRPSCLTLLDIGAGSGDNNRKLLRWADREKVDLQITLADITEEACSEARKQFADEPRVQVIRKNALDLQGEQADIVTASQFVHHFTGQQLVDMAEQLVRLSGRGVVLNDIHRHWLAWSAVWLATRILSRNRYIRHDGPLSVAKGFRDADWEQLKLDLTDRLGPITFEYSWRPLFRYAVLVDKVRSFSISS
nr:methyltransferase domain-containing protein [Paenibacillus senegalensis]